MKLQGLRLEFENGGTIYYNTIGGGAPWLAPTSQENFEKYAL